MESISLTAVSICEPVTKLEAPSAKLAADSAVGAGVDSGAEVVGAGSLGAGAETASVSLAEEAASCTGAEALAAGVEDEAAAAGAALGYQTRKSVLYSVRDCTPWRP